MHFRIRRHGRSTGSRLQDLEGFRAAVAAEGILSVQLRHPELQMRPGSRSCTPFPAERGPSCTSRCKRRVSAQAGFSDPIRRSGPRLQIRLDLALASPSLRQPIVSLGFRLRFAAACVCLATPSLFSPSRNEDRASPATSLPQGHRPRPCEVMVRSRAHLTVSRAISVCASPSILAFSGNCSNRPKLKSRCSLLSIEKRVMPDLFVDNA